MYKDKANHTRLKDRILAGLGESTPDRREIITGGHDANQIATALGVTVQTARRTLKELERDGLAVAYAPRKRDREDGRTAASRVWFKTSKEYRARQARIAGRTE